jgi:hypothetical protein
MSIEKPIIYFSKPGESNTEGTLLAAKERAEELGIKNVVVASTRGGTGVKAVELFEGYNVVVVPGARAPGRGRLVEEMEKKIKAGGGKIVIATNTLAGANTAIQRKFSTVYPAGIIAQTLRFFGQGMKVCVEIAAMATDSGHISAGQDVISVAGAGGGADTAVVIKTANSRDLFDIVVKEVIAKPRSW